MKNRERDLFGYIVWTKFYYFYMLHHIMSSSLMKTSASMTAGSSPVPAIWFPIGSNLRWHKPVIIDKQEHKIKAGVSHKKCLLSLFVYHDLSLLCTIRDQYVLVLRERI